MKYPKAVIMGENKIKLQFDKDDIMSPIPAKEIPIRNAGNFANMGYWLDNEYDYIIVKDDEDNLVLLKMLKGTI